MSNTTPQTTTRTTLRSNEFSCPSCVGKIEKQLGRTPGVTAAKVHFTTGRIEIEHDAEVAGVDTLVEAVAKAGYRATPSAF